MSLRGRCLCGGVRFVVDAPFENVAHCHCTTCKQIAGGPGTTSIRAPSAAVEIVAGADLLHTFQPDEGSAKTFCSACGANLFGGGWPDSEHASIRVTALEDVPDRPLAAHIWTRSLAAWETLPDDGAERFERGRP